MKNRLAIFLLVIFLTDIAGYYVVFSIHQIVIKQNIKNSIRQKLPDELLTLIISTPSNIKEIHWKEKGEFRYRRNMYDVVRKYVNSGDTIYYYCINDKAETKLFSNLDEFIEKFRESQKDDSILLQTYQAFHSVLFFGHYLQNIFPSVSNELIFTYIGTGYTSNIPDISGPPPETMV
jgi:hypothetical protein